MIEVLEIDSNWDLDDLLVTWLGALAAFHFVFFSIEMIDMLKNDWNYGWNHLLVTCLGTLASFDLNWLRFQAMIKI